MAREPKINNKPRDLYQEATDKIVGALEAGAAPWVCPWRRDADGGRPRDGASGHIYRGINILLTGMAGYASSRWYTFKQAQGLGGHVRRGEKGSQVVYWTFIDAKAERAGNDDAGPVAARRIPILKCYTIFNAAQIAWSQGSKHAVHQGADNQVLDLDGDDHGAARTLVEATGAEIHHGGDRAYYAPAGDFIRVPDEHRFEKAGDYYATVLHELAHWTGHESRLARDLTGRFGSEAYAAEELVAELAAAFMCAEVLVAGRLQHAEYIASWIKVLKGDKRAIFTASRMAQNAADYLTRRVASHDAEDATQTAPEALVEAA